MVGLLDIVHWIFLQVLPSCSLSICTYLDSEHTDLWMYHCFTSTLRLKIEFYDSLILMQKKHIGKQWTWWWTDEHPISGKKTCTRPQDPQAVPEPVAWTLPSDSNARGRCVASKRFGGTTPDPPHREALVNHGFCKGFSMENHGFSNDFPMNYGFSNGNQWFSNDFPISFKEKSEPETMDLPMKWEQIPVDFTHQSIEQW